MQQFSPITPDVQEQSLVFVTGATGLLGCNLVRELAVQGFRVCALIRSEAKARRFFSDVDTDLSRITNHFRGASLGVRYRRTAHFRPCFEQSGNHDVQFERINICRMFALTRAADRQYGFITR